MKAGISLLTGFVCVAMVGLTSCKKPAPVAPPAAATPVPTPEEGFAGVAQATPDPMSSPEPAREVEAPATVNTDVADAENAAVKAEVLRRIDVMPNLSDEEKDKLYVQVERARGMGKVVTIPFSSGKTVIGSGEITALAQKLSEPQIKKYAEDPTVVFVVLGFADKKGGERINQGVSLERAASVVKVLTEKAGMMNVVHAVGMGGSEMFDSQNLDKNRVVEVWVVLP